MTDECLENMGRLSVVIGQMRKEMERAKEITKADEPYPYKMGRLRAEVEAIDQVLSRAEEIIGGWKNE